MGERLHLLLRQLWLMGVGICSLATSIISSSEAASWPKPIMLVKIRQMQQRLTTIMTTTIAPILTSTIIAIVEAVKTQMLTTIKITLINMEPTKLTAMELHFQSNRPKHPFPPMMRKVKRHSSSLTTMSLTMTTARAIILTGRWRALSARATRYCFRADRSRCFSCSRRG